MKKIIVQVADRYCGKLVNETWKSKCFATVFLFSKDRIYCDAFNQRLRVSNRGDVLRCQKCRKSEKILKEVMNPV